MEKNTQIITLSKNIINNNDDKLTQVLGFKSEVLDTAFNCETFKALATGELTNGMTETQLDELITEIKTVMRKLDAISFLRPSLQKWISCIRYYCNFDMTETRTIELKQEAGFELTVEEEEKLNGYTTKVEYVEVFEKVLDVLDNMLKIQELKKDLAQGGADFAKSEAGLAVSEKIKALSLDLPKNKVVKLLAEFINNVTNEQFKVSKFNNRVVFSVNLRRTDGSRYEINSTSALAFTEQFVSQISQNLKTPVSLMCQTLIELYDIGTRGDYLTPYDDTDENEYVERFAEHIDSQVGKGGFAAYLLYPLLYNDANVRKDLGIKRHIVVGTMASTGKSILGKFLKLFYKDVPYEIGARIETSKGGYNATKHSWNGKIVDKSIVYIDDDSADNSEREDFYKNLWAQNGLTTGTSGKEKTGTFRGFCYSNANKFDSSISEHEQVSKRVYVFVLNKLFSSTFNRDDANVFYSMESRNPKITRDAVINYLNKHREDAINWLVNYKQPEDVVNDSISRGTTEYDLIVIILKLLAQVTADNKEGTTPWIPINHIKSIFGTYVGDQKLTGKFIESLGNGEYFKTNSPYVAMRRVKADEEGNTETVFLIGKNYAGAAPTYCVGFQSDISIDDFDKLTDDDKQELIQLFAEATESSREMAAPGSVLTPEKIQAILSVNMATDKDATLDLLKSIISVVSTNEEMMNELKSLINNDITTTK